jgi:threonine aldolase
MFSPETDDKRWPTFRDEEATLALREDYLERMEVTIKRLGDLIAQAQLLEAERQLLLYQLSHIQQHLRESLNMLLAKKLLSNN